MKVGPLEVTFHRTVRVADGRTPSNLPPSLGRATVTPVAKFKDNCPEGWDETGVFVPLHDKEALWMSFHGGPVAVLVGAGGVNAITGQKLGTKLEAGNYIVTPPQPWLDGWKAEDGTVYQFVATPFKGGEGLSVGEQVLGAESKSGGIGIAVFEPREPLKAQRGRPTEGVTNTAWGDDFKWAITEDCAGAPASAMLCSTGPTRSMRAAEMGIGKGGRIHQKVYADPHGLDKWKEVPVAAMAVYLVSAADYKEITGVEIPPPASFEKYQGPWFGLQDEGLTDTPGSPIFAGLNTVFTGDTTNIHAEEPEAEAPATVTVSD